MTVWLLIGTICTGYMPPVGETGCHERIGWQEFATKEQCENYLANRDQRMVQLRCAEKLKD